MTKKRTITKMAKEIRKHTQRDFISSIELAKAFLKSKMQYEETDKVEGFVYEYDSELSIQGYSRDECMFPTGEIYIKGSTIKKWTIPRIFYEMRKKF